MTNIQYHTIKLSHMQMSYLQAGEGVPLLLLHGFPQHSHMWRKLIPELANHYLVIAPDLRGMGGSSILPGGYEKKTLAEDLRAFVEALKLDSLYLVGYDLGGGVAYAFTATYPDKVRQLAIIEYVPPGFGYEYGLQPVRDWQSWQLAFFTVPDVAVQFILGKERELLAWYFWHWSYNPEAVGQDDFEIYVRQLQKPGALRAGFSYFASVFDDLDYFKTLAQQKITIPVLALGGELGAGSFMVPGWQQLAEQVEGRVIPQTGHWIADEAPAVLIQELRHFFN